MMNSIFHITTEKAWELAQKEGAYRAPSLDNEGFIHCSTESQIQGTLKKHFKGKTNLVLLEIKEESVKHLLKYEESEGKWFPHLYGEIALSVVTAVSKISPFSE